jgi:hypothetical protein
MIPVTEIDDYGPGLLELSALTIDCSDPAVLGAFYTAVLGGTVTDRSDDVLFLQTAALTLIFRRVSDYKPPTWPSPEVPLQMHFELVVDDPAQAVIDLGRLGATPGSRHDVEGPDIRVMLDPAGHPFCVIRRSAAARQS